MKKITFLTFIFAAAGLFLVSMQTVKAADVCHCAGANKNIINFTSDVLQRLTSADLCNQECSSKGYAYFIYADSNSPTTNFIAVTKSSTAAASDTKGCCRYISRGSGQWIVNSNYRLDGCKTYGATTSWEFYPGDTSSDCSNPNNVTPITGSSSTPPASTPTPTPTTPPTINQNTTCSSVTVCSEKNVGKACCDKYTNEISFYEGVCEKVDASKYDCAESLSVIIKKTFPTCFPACTSTQNCEKMTSGDWKCVEKAPDSCNGKCTSTQSCEKMTSGDWKCVEKPPVASNTGTFMDIPFTNPLRFNTVQGFLGSVLDALRQIIVVLSIIFIVIGGIMYIVSIGDEKRMTTAKGAITASMIGLALGIAAPSFLKEIYTVLGAKSDSGVDTSGLVGPTLSAIALRFLDFLLAIVGVLALIMLIIGGMMYLTSAGEEKRIETGRKIITWAIVGIAISLASLVIVKQIANLLK